MPLSGDMTVWPGHQAPALHWNRTWAQQHEQGFRSISSNFCTNVHNGTHVDAPLHFIPDGASVDELSLDRFMGPAVVIDVTAAEQITAEVLAQHVPQNAERILLRTQNSLRRIAGQREFDTSFVALTADAAHWLVDAKVKLIANDYPSIAVYKGDSEIHLALMRADIGILEGVVLDHVEPGNYELACLPMLIAGAEGAPARAMLRRR